MARQLAWLQATPRPPRGSKRADKFDLAAAISRREQIRKNGVEPPLPPNPAPHIIERLVEMGLTEAAGMGAAPLSWPTIDAWQRSTCVTLPPWEARLMRRLSSDYLAESRRAEDESCPPPWRAPITAGAIDAEIRALNAVLG